MKYLKLIFLLITILIILFSSCAFNDIFRNHKNINEETNIFNFSNFSAKQNEETFGFAISSDPHFFSKNSNLQTSIKILQILEKYFEEGKIEAFFCLGDFFDNGGIKQNWIEFIKLKNKYAPILPIFSVIGNHDRYFGGQKYWINLFGNNKNINQKNLLFKYVIKNNPITLNNNPDYFFINGPTPFVWHYKYKKFHFIGLNLPWAYFDTNEKEKQWIKTEIQKISKDDFLVILSHSFFYASGYKDISGNWFDNMGNIENIAPIFIEKADLVISGHNHYMEWIEKMGIYWVIIGAMGGKPDPIPTFITNGSKWFTRGKFGFFLIENKNGNINFSFIDQSENILYEIILYRE